MPQPTVAPPTIGEEHEHGKRAEELDALAQHDPVDPDRPRDRRRADEPGILVEGRVKSDTAALNHTHGSSAVMRNTMYGSSPTSALEDLGEDEPVDEAHHQRVEHRPEVAQRARGVAHTQVARGQQPQRVEVAPGRSGGADGGCGHGVESMAVITGRRSAPIRRHPLVYGASLPLSTMTRSPSTACRSRWSRSRPDRG